ncbi:mitochondrial import inner membrane translocase subunit Tim10 isoform X3 [Engraulis encrasicolus]
MTLAGSEMWWYDHSPLALRMLEELQRQQQCNVFCDTLLQAEGFAVPVHSCVLAASSPFLFKELSSYPPPVGQRWLIKVPDTGAQALLTLVSFLYTGEMRELGFEEYMEVKAVFNRLGMSHLVPHFQVEPKDMGSMTGGGLQFEWIGDTPPSVDPENKRMMADERSAIDIATQTEAAHAAAQAEAKRHEGRRRKYSSGSNSENVPDQDTAGAAAADGGGFFMKMKFKRKCKGALWGIEGVEDSAAPVAQDGKPCVDASTSGISHSANAAITQAEQVAVESKDRTDGVLAHSAPSQPVLYPSLCYGPHTAPHPDPDPHPHPHPQPEPPISQPPSGRASPLSQLEEPVECDEQLDKLLDDVLMGLDIMPNTTERGHSTLQPTPLPYLSTDSSSWLGAPGVSRELPVKQAAGPDLLPAPQSSSSSASSSLDNGMSSVSEQSSSHPPESQSTQLPSPQHASTEPQAKPDPPADAPSTQRTLRSQTLAKRSTAQSNNSSGQLKRSAVQSNDSSLDSQEPLAKRPATQSNSSSSPAQPQLAEGSAVESTSSSLAETPLVNSSSAQSDNTTPGQRPAASGADGCLAASSNSPAWFRPLPINLDSMVTPGPSATQKRQRKKAVSQSKMVDGNNNSAGLAGCKVEKQKPTVKGNKNLKTPPAVSEQSTGTASAGKDKLQRIIAKIRQSKLLLQTKPRMSNPSPPSVQKPPVDLSEDPVKEQSIPSPDTPVVKRKRGRPPKARLDPVITSPAQWTLTPLKEVTCVPSPPEVTLETPRPRPKLKRAKGQGRTPDTAAAADNDDNAGNLAGVFEAVSKHLTGRATRKNVTNATGTRARLMPKAAIGGRSPVVPSSTSMARILIERYDANRRKINRREWRKDWNSKTDACLENEDVMERTLMKSPCDENGISAEREETSSLQKSTKNIKATEKASSTGSSGEEELEVDIMAGSPVSLPVPPPAPRPQHSRAPKDPSSASEEEVEVDVDIC